MTFTPEDQPTLWLKQVPLNNNSAPGVWDTKLLDNHRPVGRSRERPRAEVDDVTLSQLRRAASSLLQKKYDPKDPEVLALHQALMAFDSREQDEREGKV